MANLKETIAAAIANARGGRRGAPSIVNVLEILPPRLLEEVMDDADAVIEAIAQEPDAMAELRIKIAARKLRT